MLNELKSLELSAPSLALMTSISQTQTSGLRNVLKEKVIFFFKLDLNNFKKFVIKMKFIEKTSNNQVCS